MTMITENEINIISEGTCIEGKIKVGQISRVHGILKGEVFAEEGSLLILSETSVVEGNLQADRLQVDGYVRGNISAKSKVILSRTARVVGNIRAPALVIEFGAYFEGRSIMENLTPPLLPEATVAIEPLV